MIRTRIKALLAWVYALLMYGFIFLPVAVLVIFSFQNSRLPIMPFQGPTLKWYETVLSDARLVDSMINSLLVAMGSSMLAVVLGFLAAYALARFHLPAKGLQRALLTAPLTVSYLIIALGLLIMFNALGISTLAVDGGYRSCCHQHTVMFRHYLQPDGRSADQHRTSCA